MSFAPQHILVPVDIDALADVGLAETLVDAAADLAKRVGAKLTLLHVARPVLAPMSPPMELVDLSYQTVREIEASRNKLAIERLVSLTTRATASGVKADHVLDVEAGSVPKAILETAKAQHADLIVLSSHGRRGIQRLLLGSVAERTVHLSPIPVLLLPPSPPPTHG